jgi:hypothetical protein
MAHVTTTNERARRIDAYLSYLARAWEGIPALADEWDEWDELSRLTFAADWRVKEDRLCSLNTLAADGEMTPAQCARYEELLRLVAQQRPTLDRLLAD